MKVVVIACLEPEHLVTCLRSLALWVPAADTIVVNNASVPQNASRIAEIGFRFSIPVVRPHALCHGENTILYINEALKVLCGKYAGEIVLKVDEDVILVSSAERFRFEPGVFFVPNVTINNFTSKNYLHAFWPDLDEACASHDWMWHRPHPISGADFRVELMKRFYTIHPRWLIRHCGEAPAVEYVSGADWQTRHMMSDRGISSTVMAFHAADYLALVGARQGVEEILLAEGVRSGPFRYKIDYGLFCHHVNYYSIRSLVQENSRLVEAFHRRIFEHYQGGTPARGGAST
jgi:hypothetical protein